ncbi:sensor histidine kinase [Streptococcus ferus]|uniref:sensor histidine kinase n=1 Tax=Streptococcus ferus TaxID=1345 RepID=UPI00359F1FF1
MSFGKKMSSLKTSIIFRVTLWYSIFISLLVLFMLVSAFMVSGSFADAKHRRELERSAREISHDKEDYESFDDGIYYAIYQSDESVSKGAFPKGFKKDLAYNGGQIKEYSVNGKTYYYFDVKFSNGGSSWLRAMMQKTSLNDDVMLLFIVMVLVSPVLLTVIIWGGYAILKRAFRPVEQMSQTALAIQREGDFSKRIVLGPKDDELHRLGQTFNHMLDSVEASFEREKQFNNDVSHELRTPVAVILSESQYGADYADTLDEAKESHQIINRQAKRMRELIDQIMDLSKIDSGRIQALSGLNLSDLVAGRLQEFQKLCQEKSVTLESVIVPNCMIQGNELLLLRLLDNLLSNALKFTKDKIEVKVEAADGWTYLKVKDNGPGIPQEDQAKIWNRFYQVDSSRHKTETSGSGLGLSLVKEIVNVHQGQIYLASQIGQGSQFQVAFPSLSIDH